MIKQIVCLCSLILGFASFVDAKPPNFLFILSDDQAWTDYGFMDHPVIQTPHLDKLAQESLLFERGYVAAPLCRPSLASMVTGLYPFQHGITGNDANGKTKRAELDIPIRNAFHKHPSIIKLLTENGYRTHQSGKWWEGSYQDGGFTHGMTHGDPKRGGRHGDAGLIIGRQSLDPVTDFIDESVAADKPFFVWYAPFLPHTPHNPPQKYLKKYQTKDRPADVAKYFAMCEWFDQTCGDLLAHLEEKQLRENTVVIYICDNGWAARSTNADDPNQKLWGGFAQRSKCSPYENGIRTPIMVSWPGKIEPTRSPDIAHAIDLFPTIATLAGLETPENLTGIDLLDSEVRHKRQAVFGVCNSTHNMMPENPDGTLQYLWCVAGDWKLIVRHDGLDSTRYSVLHSWDKAPYHLYNLKEDPHEQHDLSEAHPEIVSRLKSKIEDWHPVRN